ncbi:MAG: hypothetical protein WC878_04755 [Candidatus Paceibacterota bacterium]|jgi:hypothetical protein
MKKSEKKTAEYAEHIGFLNPEEDLPVFFVHIKGKCYAYYMDIKTKRICALAFNTYDINKASTHRYDGFPASEWDWLHEAEKRNIEISSSGRVTTNEKEDIRNLLADTYIGKKIGLND